MSKKLKPIEWKTNSIKIDFSAIQDQKLGWAVKAISEYKAIPAALYTKIFSEIPSANLLLRDSKGEVVEHNNTINMMLDLVYAEWNTLVLWVVKDRWKLFNIHDGPLPEIVMKVYEPKARLVIAELELWDAIFDASRDMKTALLYDNCIQAWTQTQIESKRSDLSTICHGIGQKRRANNLAKQKAQLMLQKNPFHLDDLNEAHHYNMIDAALSIAKCPGRREQDAITEVRKNFRSRVWHPYLKAMEAYIKSLRDGITLSDGSEVKAKAMFAKGERLMLQDGKQAKNVLPILLPTAKKSFHQRGKYVRKA